MIPLHCLNLVIAEGCLQKYARRPTGLFGTFRLLFKNVGIKIEKTVISPVILYECDTVNERETQIEKGVFEPDTEENIWT